MNNITDIFYYDYLLYIIIQMYNEGRKSEEIAPYLQITSIFSVKFDRENIELDCEPYIKALYIKLIQYCRLGKISCINNAIHTISFIDKRKNISDRRYTTIKNIIFSCYNNLYKKKIRNLGKNFENSSEDNDYINRLKIIDNLKKLVFNKPLICEFIEEKSKQIFKNNKNISH